MSHNIKADPEGKEERETGEEGEEKGTERGAEGRGGVNGKIKWNQTLMWLFPFFRL